MHPFLRYANEKLPGIVELIRELVECESPSDSPADVNRFVELLSEKTKDIASIETTAAAGYGPHLRLEFRMGASEAAPQVLGVGHSDTVWPAGTLAQMPFREADGRLWGPGVLDMKGGLAFFVFATRMLIDLGVPVARRVVLLVVSDEEVGSVTSRPITEAEARKSECVLVVEPGTGLSGKLKTARKGVGRYLLTVHGKASHAGVDFENGASAIVEAARQIQSIASLTDLQQGITVNPGVIQGGTRSNVVAAEARVEVDVRAAQRSDAEAIDRKLRGLTAFDTRCQLSMEGGINRPPMERSQSIAALFGKARAIAEGMGLRVEESATGGGSDGNFTAALGTPTLDGLGAVGEGAHASNESILIDRIPDRVALLAGLIAG